VPAAGSDIIDNTSGLEHSFIPPLRAQSRPIRAKRQP
jgi:hypothetical protein